MSGNGKKVKKKLSGALESYLENIADLQSEHGAVRTSDLAKKMGFSLPSVTSALKRLAEKELIRYESYRPVILTEKGKETISRLNRFHGILADFLTNVLVFPEEYAQEEACLLEHKISIETLERIEKLMIYVRNPSAKKDFLDHHKKDFAEFLK
jgi:DtxR family Mn-dependent transcriptional regulator